MVIKLAIHAENEKTTDSFITGNTTLQENAMVLRRLEEMKQKLLSMEYKADMIVERKPEDFDDDINDEYNSDFDGGSKR